ncbi:hypothetical protein LuPra_00994 [Luteitalea pratensis]|uniref:Uncharacterized protein n=1 Tax=Luteitalea pratensis TaxID=1855912 RepID=A0A143PHT5_LUTPR|nr:hypothetical protein [Luteitalea pratensis]AMY07813.1 hypothetical protein LuPra_00994 [Luteitalea pratensis]
MSSSGLCLYTLYQVIETSGGLNHPDGTGRFAAATGTFTIHVRQEIDFATSMATGSGSFEGHVSLNN